MKKEIPLSRKELSNILYAIETNSCCSDDVDYDILYNKINEYYNSFPEVKEYYRIKYDLIKLIIINNELKKDKLVEKIYDFAENNVNYDHDKYEVYIDDSWLYDGVEHHCLKFIDKESSITANILDVLCSGLTVDV